MAPSANRRSGNSRRAQYRTFFGYIVGVLGVVAGAVFLLISILGSDILSGARGAATQAAEPVGDATAHGRAAGKGVFDVVKGYVLAGSRMARLEHELETAKTQLAEAQAIKAENRRLKALLGLAQREPGAVTVTRLTGSSASSTRRFATLGAGKASGVMSGMPVRSRLGLIGRVLDVSGSSARVLLITDTESLVPVRRATDDVAAFAQGLGNGTIQIRLLSLGVNPLKPGDVFVTSGSGGLYRPGTPVAVVGKLKPDGAIAHILADPAAIDHVVVEPVWAPEAIAPAASAPAPPEAATSE